MGGCRLCELGRACWETFSKIIMYKITMLPSSSSSEASNYDRKRRRVNKSELLVIGRLISPGERCYWIPLPSASSRCAERYPRALPSFVGCEDSKSAVSAKSLWQFRISILVVTSPETGKLSEFLSVQRKKLSEERGSDNPDPQEKKIGLRRAWKSSWVSAT